MASEMNSSMHSRRLGPHGTPESEFNHFECFQNYTAPEVFVQGLAGIVNQGDVELMIRAQKQMLQRFEKTNEMLLNCNALSASRLKTAGEDFKKHTKLLSEMKKDLDYIFKKIRIIKTKVSIQYPDAYAAAQPSSSKNSFAEEAEDDCDVAVGVAAKETDTQQKDETTAGPSSANVVKPLKLLEKKKSLSGNKISIDYVQMEQSPSDTNDRHSVDASAKRRSLESNRSTSTDNSNDSSDCTSDTG